MWLAWPIWVQVDMPPVMSFLCSVHQMAVSSNFLNNCGIDWLSSKQGLSAVSHKTATGYSTCNRFHFLCAFVAAAQQLPAVSFFFSNKYLLLYTIEAMLDACSLVLVQIEVVCLLSWFRQHWNFWFTYRVSCERDPCAHVPVGDWKYLYF